MKNSQLSSIYNSHSKLLRSYTTAVPLNLINPISALHPRLLVSLFMDPPMAQQQQRQKKAHYVLVIKS